MASRGSSNAPGSPALSAVAAPKTSPRPQWFISRGNGRYVPLLPADELPEGITLAGVPRSATLDQLSGMTFLAEVPSTGTAYLLEGATSNQSNRAYRAPDADVRMLVGSPIHSPRLVGRTAPTSTPSATRPSSPLAASSLPMAQSTSVLSAIIQADPSSADRFGYKQRPVPPSGKEPEQSKKIYCTHWIRTGECDFTQQGCLYKHEMPDMVGLRKIGFQTMPRWWQEKTATRVVAPERPIAKGEDIMARLYARLSGVSGDDTQSGGDSGSDSSVSVGRTESVPRARVPTPQRSTSAVYSTNAVLTVGTQAASGHARAKVSNALLSNYPVLSPSPPPSTSIPAVSLPSNPERKIPRSIAEIEGLIKDPKPPPMRPAKTASTDLQPEVDNLLLSFDTAKAARITAGPIKLPPSTGLAPTASNKSAVSSPRPPTGLLQSRHASVHTQQQQQSLHDASLVSPLKRTLAPPAIDIYAQDRIAQDRRRAVNAAHKGHEATMMRARKPRTCVRKPVKGKGQKQPVELLQMEGIRTPVPTTVGREKSLVTG